MRHALSGTTEIAPKLTQSGSLLIFNFDGTLAPIVWDYQRAELRGSTRRLVVRLCDFYRCAVISGRGDADIRDRLGGISFDHVVGNHGAETTPEDWSAPVVNELRPRLAGLPGVEIEDKQRGVAIHYRKSPHPLQAADAIVRAIGALGPSVRALSGKLAYDLLPPDAPTRGDVVRDLRRRTAATSVLYVGDDVADEDAFALDEPWLTGIRVGPSSRSRAPYFVSDQREVDSILHALLAF
jgi:trehalose 6-phosphate phosphatase